jgi:N-acetylmuramoyl-L-alanine amidase
MNFSKALNFIKTCPNPNILKVFAIFFCSFVLTSFNSSSAFYQTDLMADQMLKRIPNLEGIKKVVIDAGHGGEDPGCLGSKVKEKEVALSVALKLGKLIEENFKDVEVVYTRKTDVFIELHKRAQIANESKADLFICIHCNSGPKAAYGTETYVMGIHKSVDNLSVAKRENESILMESNYAGNYDGFDPKSPEANIIFSLYQNAFMDQSLDFASLVQDQVKTNIKRYDRGVKQAGFLVLYKTTMPSVLIETGFLTNQDEEKFLNSTDGQNHMAQAIFKAFENYKNKMEGKAVNSVSVALNVPIKDTITPINNDLKNAETENNFSSQIVFRVQIATSSVKIPLSSSEFKEVTNIKEIKIENLYKYYAGEFLKLEDAQQMQSQVRAKGIKDAFVVAFNNGKAIPVAEAKKLMSAQAN